MGVLWVRFALSAFAPRRSRLARSTRGPRSTALPGSRAGAGALAAGCCCCACCAAAAAVAAAGI
eukprot:scaffold34556_cov129-Isochrysis_galbana.AAC.10